MEVTQKALRELQAMVQGIREGGPDFDICIEGHGKFNVGSAVTIAKVLEPFRPLFFEEPIPGMNAQAMREVQLGTTAKVRVAVVPLSSGCWRVRITLRCKHTQGVRKV